MQEALEVLARSGEETKVLAGGQSLIPLMKLRLASPARLLDIGRLRELGGIRREDGFLRIGALTRHADIESSSMPPGLEFLREGVRVIGDPQVRNLGTIGGALAEVDPAGDWCPMLLALTTSVICRSSSGERVVPLKEFSVDAYTPALTPAELLTEVRIELPPVGSGGAYLKLERKAGDFAIASSAVVVQAGEKDRIESIGIGLGGVGLTPVKAEKAEKLLRGKELSEEAVVQAVETLMGEINPLADLRGSADYKREVAGVLFRRALTSAWGRARSGSGKRGQSG